MNTRRSDRGQTGLPAVAISLLILTVVTGLGLAMADGALAGADRNPEERRVASSLAERLVASESPLTERANVLDRAQLDRLDGVRLSRDYPVVREHAVRVRVNGSTVAETGDATGGTSFRRLVVVEDVQRRTFRPDLGPAHVTMVPRRTDDVTIEISPPPGSTVTNVRANERELLRNGSGLSGRFDVSLSRYETTQLRFGGSGPLPNGSVVVHYDAPRTKKSTLVVTVDG